MNRLAASGIWTAFNFTCSTFHLTTVGPLIPRRQVLLSQVAVMSVETVWITDIYSFLGSGVGLSTQSGCPSVSSWKLNLSPQKAAPSWALVWNT